MYQILIVDDEAIEREVVRYLLGQQNFPLEVTEAVNGKEALSLLSAKKFDILFTDIRMPFVNGLELASKARDLYPDISIIFFSGYDDFSYVKEALSLHVVNYILKPITSEEFLKTITEVLEHIQLQEKTAHEQYAAEQYSRQHILYQLASKADIRQIKERYPHLDLSFAYAYHRLFLIQLERDYFGKSQRENDNVFSSVGLQLLLPEDCCFINLNPAQNLLLFTDTAHLFSWYQNLANQIVRHIQQECGINCCIAISNPFSGPEGISLAYEEAERNLIDQFFSMDPSLPASSTVSSNVLEADDAFLKQLQMDIQFKDAVGLKNHMTALIGAWKNKKKSSMIYFHFFCTRVLKLLLEGLHQDSEAAFEKSVTILYRANHLSQVEALLLQMTEELADHLSKEQTSPKYVLHQVNQYIYQHYGEDLSLDILAKKVYLTPRYLSALFIKENGYGINRYIKKVRMEKACDLLINTNQKISDISRQVGYSNLSYFCKSFAEDFGTTPDKFRNQKLHPTERN